ncbi:MAG: polysaccharide deacetylase family protein [Oscillospiraceae bacterium]|jgi:peptidoglycan/xylan/chitin deacetylase (PgdA/CDA1 family)|nr:polysaccharide deacetylase family protein [Oscillospiraceae bacterium]
MTARSKNITRILTAVLLLVFAYLSLGCSAPTVVAFNVEDGNPVEETAEERVSLSDPAASDIERQMIKIVITESCDTAIQYPDTGNDSANGIVKLQILPYLESLIRKADLSLAPSADGERLSRSVVYNMRITLDSAIDISFIEETESGYSLIQSFTINIENPSEAKLTDRLEYADAQNSVEPTPQVPFTGTKKRIALTFDDGPSTYTTEILAALRESNAKATFCVVGSKVSRFSDTIAQAAAQGSEVVGHTWDHPDLTKLSQSDIKWQINRTAAAIENITGIKTTMYRPPYGAYNSTVRQVSEGLNMSLLIWSIDTEDWKYVNEERLYNYVLENAKDGVIILCHDTYQSTMRAAVRLIPELVNRGFELVTASELLTQNDAALTLGKPYFGEY